MGLMTAISSGDMADRVAETSTTVITGMRSTKKPVDTLIAMAVTRAGRIRSDAPKAEVP